jgi:S-adenosylmethionine:tRNA ribosyltransferase-isomerase
VKAAIGPRNHPRLLWIDPKAERFQDSDLAALPELLRAGDVLVVNDAATLPSSLRGRGPSGEAVEVRLIGRAASSGWTAVLFGGGDWRTRTEDRPAPPPLKAGDAVTFGHGLVARVGAVSPLSSRLVELDFNLAGARFYSALYRSGRVVQYAHLARPLPLGEAQTAYASRPWASETPSAGYALNWELLLEIVRAGVHLAYLTHAAGLSSTGDPFLDARLPLPESFEIPEDTALAVQKPQGGRVVAVGTSVVRALEGAMTRGRLEAGEGVTDLKIGPDFRPRVVGGLLTGLHEAGSSHLELLKAFVPPTLLEKAYSHAEEKGYLGHEFGDSCLILPA